MQNNITLNKSTAKRVENKGIQQRYWDFCEGQKDQSLLWYILALLILSSAVMPIGIYFLADATYLIHYIAIGMFLFLVNMTVNVAEMPTKWTISIFLMTILYHLMAIIVHGVVGI